MIKRNLTFVFLGLVFLVACSPKLKQSTSKNKHFKVETAFTQVEIPGKQDAKSKDYLNLWITIKPDHKVMFDRVVFAGKSFRMEGSQRKWKLNRALGQPDNRYNLKVNEALLFYQIEGKTYQYLIPDVQLKQPVYLP